MPTDTLPLTSSSSFAQNPEIHRLCDQHHPALTDLGNAQRFAELFSDTVRYIPAHGWFLFSQTHWQQVDTNTMLFLARESLDEFLGYASKLTDEDTVLCDRILKHLARSESLPRLYALLRLARTIPEMLLPHTALDADPYLLNLRNGTLDLRTGELLPHNPEHHLTHLLPYNYAPEATSSIWTSFLDRFTNSTLLSNVIFNAPLVPPSSETLPNPSPLSSPDPASVLTTSFYPLSAIF